MLDSIMCNFRATISFGLFKGSVSYLVVGLIGCMCFKVGFRCRIGILVQVPEAQYYELMQLSKQYLEAPCLTSC